MTTMWEQLTWIGHDSFLAIADVAVPAAKQVEALRATNIEYRLIDATKNGISVVAAFTEAVEDVPVEVRRDDHGTVVSLRLCWTNDVDDLDNAGDGYWHEVAELRFTKGSCVVWDPYHGDIEDGVVVRLVPGDFAVETFDSAGDCLGLRISAKESAHGM